MKQSTSHKLFGSIKLILVAVIMVGSYLIQTQSASASCGIWTFDWDFKGSDAVYSGDVLSKEVYATPTLENTEGERKVYELYKYTIRVEDTLKGEHVQNDYIDVYEVSGYDDYSYGMYDLPYVSMYAEVGDLVYLKLKDGLAGYSPASNGACDSAVLSQNAIDKDIQSSEEFLEEYKNSENPDDDYIIRLENELSQLKEFSNDIDELFLDKNLPDVENTVFESHINNNFKDGVDIGLSYGIGPSKNSVPNFIPDENTTRAEFVSMLGRAFDIETGEYTYQESYSFPDIANHMEYDRLNPNGYNYFYDNSTVLYIDEFAELDLINGYSDGTFKPNNSISRAEATKILVNVLDYKGLIDTDAQYESSFLDIDENNVFYEYISIVNTLESNDRKIMSGYSDGKFKAEFNITRGQSNKIIDLARNM